jgi:hypothetical protein
MRLQSAGHRGGHRAPTTWVGGAVGGDRRGPGGLRPRRGRHWALALASGLLVLSGCSLHVTKHGVSGNAFGHSFSGATGALPAGFPSDVPTPDHSRVLGGGGTNNTWDVAFAVTGSAASETSAYQAKVQSAGYTISNVQTGSSPIAGGTGANSSPTTISAAGSVFTAKNAQWTMQVVSAATSSQGTGLRPGEFAINITVVPASSTTSST